MTVSMPGVEVGGTAELVGGSLEVTGAEVAAKSAVGNTAETGGVVRVEDMAAVTLGAVGWVTDMALTALVGAGLAAISKAKEALGVARDAEERAVQTTVGALTAAVMEVEAVLKVDETMAVCGDGDGGVGGEDGGGMGRYRIRCNNCSGHCFNVFEYDFMANVAVGGRCSRCSTGRSITYE